MVIFIYVHFWLSFLLLHCHSDVYSNLMLNVITMSSFRLHCVDALQTGASQFEATSTKLKRKYWFQNIKVCFTAANISSMWYLNLKQLLHSSAPSRQ